MPLQEKKCGSSIEQSALRAVQWLMKRTPLGSFVILTNILATVEITSCNYNQNTVVSIPDKDVRDQLMNIKLHDEKCIIETKSGRIEG